MCGVHVGVNLVGWVSSCVLWISVLMDGSVDVLGGWVAVRVEGGSIYGMWMLGLIEEWSSVVVSV